MTIWHQHQNLEWNAKLNIQRKTLTNFKQAPILKVLKKKEKSFLSLIENMLYKTEEKERREQYL